jgi:hypothetical protein
MNRSLAFFLRVFFAVAFSTLLSAISGCGGNREPFEYVKVEGKVSYEDGSRIPAGLVVKFIPQWPPREGTMTPRPGEAHVDAKTGMFSHVTSHTAGDGIVAGKHKVLILQGGPLVPKEYTRPETTPLTVNASDSPFDLKVRKPKE